MRRALRLIPVTVITLISLALAVSASPFGPAARVGTTLEDFFLSGSQPTGATYEQFRSSESCRACHAFSEDTLQPIHARWQGSMMAQAARDPLFEACLTIANQDAAFAGDICLRCHTPGGWLSGRSDPTDGSALVELDRDGVSCSVCHRMVDPVFDPVESPAVDASLLDALASPPAGFGNGRFVMDTMDRRRGPYSDIGATGHLTLHSPFHREAALCGTCHDVSNPAYRRTADGRYVLTDLDEAHPTGNTYDMFPLERTYSEWLNSDFAEGGVDMQGRFGGGGGGVVSTCQDCHMPKVTAKGCIFDDAPVRSDLAAHDLAGGNAWVQDMVANLHAADFDEAGLRSLLAGKERAVSMLQRAATLEVSQRGNRLEVRVINETGHKLPSGYPEGRRMWLNVEVRDAGLSVAQERGRYDAFTAELTTEDTKVYEAVLGVDETVASLAGIAAGKGFHFALNNVILKDNRIPPRGFTNAAFRAVQAAPVAASYADGQYWDDTSFRLPATAASAEVRLRYQTASKDYITFLRDENRTNDAGQVLYDQWQITGMSPPVEMASVSIQLAPFPIGDFDDDGTVTLVDYETFVASCAGAPRVGFPSSLCTDFDFDVDGDVDLADFAELQYYFSE